MKTNKDLVKIFTGLETSAVLLKAPLEDLGIYTLSKNDYTGAYMGVVQPTIDLWINQEIYLMILIKLARTSQLSKN